MNKKKYRLIFYLITVTCIATITVQFYWNYKNYKENKQHVFNEIERSLDNAVEEYYALIIKKNVRSKADLENNINKNGFIFKFKSYQAYSGLKNKTKKVSKIDLNLRYKTLYKKTVSLTAKDSLARQKNADKIKELIAPILFSISSKSINFKKLDSLVKNQLSKKRLQVNYDIQHLKKDSILNTTNRFLNTTKNKMYVTTKSSFLKTEENILLLYQNPTLETLKRSSYHILLSLLLVLLIISSLFYMLKIITNQKELASIKNDLISNITHEFKTPIATVASAIEAMENFNVLNDRIKTQKYLTISSAQLKKLHIMTEKILETAMLDSQQLMLKKEFVNTTDIVQKLVDKYQLLHKEKIFSFSTKTPSLPLYIDPFHFENVISNIIDNAVKYGGQNITVTINTKPSSILFLISDDGVGIEKQLQEKIFDQFYRIPKGNTQPVKGFGIGLYYCKEIIKKHKGTISVITKNNNTIFKIILPNE